MKTHEKAQKRLLGEFPKNSGKRGSVNTNTKSSEKMGNSPKGSEKAPFFLIGFLSLISDQPISLSMSELSKKWLNRGGTAKERLN